MVVGGRRHEDRRNKSGGVVGTYRTEKQRSKEEDEEV